MEPTFSHGVERKEMTDSWWHPHSPRVRRCHCCISLSVVSLASCLLTHLLADKANAVGLLTKTLWIRKCQGEKAEWNWNGKECRCGGVMQRVWSREGVKAGDSVKQPWPLWLEYLRGERDAAPCSAPVWAGATGQTHLWEALSVWSFHLSVRCQGVRNWQEEIWLWQQNRKTGGPRVWCNL